jgi:hypothetical protein
MKQTWGFIKFAVTAMLLCMAEFSIAQSPSSDFAFSKSEDSYVCISNKDDFKLSNNDKYYICGNYGITYISSNKTFHFSFRMITVDEELLPEVGTNNVVTKDVRITLDNEMFPNVITARRSDFIKECIAYYFTVSTRENQIVQMFLNNSIKYVTIKGIRYKVERGSRNSAIVFSDIAKNLEEKYNVHGLFKADFRELSEIKTSPVIKKGVKQEDPVKRITGETTVSARDLVEKIYGVIDWFPSESSKKDITKKLQKHFPNVGEPDFYIPGRKVVCVRNLNMKYNGVKMDPQHSNVQFKHGKMCSYGYSFNFDSSYSVRQVELFADDIVNELCTLGAAYYELKKKDFYNPHNWWVYFRSCKIKRGGKEYSIIISMEKPKADGSKCLDFSIFL